MKKRVLAAGLVGLLAATAAYNADRAYLVPHGVDHVRTAAAHVGASVRDAYKVLHDNEHRRPDVYFPK